jgi:hypothetical protein
MECSAKARTSDVVASLLRLAPRTALLLKTHPTTGEVTAETIDAELLQARQWRAGEGGWPIQAEWPFRPSCQPSPEEGCEAYNP